MNMDESIQVLCIIDKLPLSWKDFKHIFKHLKDELTLVELGSHLRIEESLRMQDSDKPKGNNVVGPSVVNMVEHNNSPECGETGHLIKGLQRWKAGNKGQCVSGINGLDGVFYQLAERAVVRLPDPKIKTLGVNEQLNASLLGYAVFPRLLVLDQLIIGKDLNSELPVYKIPSSRFNVSSTSCTLYGLKQASKQWHQKFDEVVLSNGYLLNQADKCVYSKFDETGKRFVICLYIDDMLIFGTDQVQVDLTKEFLSSRFSIKDMGEADVILVSNPMDTSEKLMPNNGQVISQLEYSMVIGCLMYAMTYTPPDFAFAMGKLS
ncbi:zinc finger, CCHC-type containing protein, partial [Tanacetum coccineum]